MRQAGIVALVDLAGRPLDPGDLRVLGLAPPSGPFAATAVDNVRPDAVHHLVDAGGTTILLGHFDEASELADRCGLREFAGQAALARAALAHFGGDLPAHALGEWSLLHFDGHGLVLMSSQARRDPVYHVRQGSLIAVAPSVHALSRLGWVDRALDERGFLIAVGPYELRGGDFAATILPSVRRLPPGGSVVHSPAAAGEAQAPVPAAPPLGRLSIEDAVEMAGETLSAIVAQRIARTREAACLLSGGLDSTLLAWQLAQARESGWAVDCLCSVAPEGSGLADEWSAAGAVAKSLGLLLHPVSPPEDLSPYRPAIAGFASGHGPIVSARHYLYDALAKRAQDLGHSSLFDGVFGEMTLTSIYPLASPTTRLRQLARRILGRSDPWETPPLQAIVRVAPHRLERLEALCRETLQTDEASVRPVSRSAPWPRVRGEILRSGLPSEMTPGGPRAEYVYRDRRLLRLFQSFPAGFIEYRGLDRAPARLLLAGHVPEPVRLQKKGLAFSPDYFQRLQRHAPAARARLPLWKQAGVDDWLDLAWLDAALQRVAERGADGQVDAQSVQLTAMVAEFLLWWHTGGE